MVTKINERHFLVLAVVSKQGSDPPRLAHRAAEARLMRKRFLTFTFERESRWLVVTN